ncbi:hypothetical protein U2054_15715, partial [Listeria monocytogenes]|uniref:hypothetical protein n=1 Tax=Listeria monocytogenes TaxID=1639 RepID=UPI002FDC5FA2
VNYTLFAKIIKECNKETIRVITQEAEIMRLPGRLGSIKINKYEKSFSKKTNWAVNFKLTKELGYTVYHDQPYIYKWMWL